MSSLLAWFRSLVAKYPITSVAASAVAGWYAGPAAKLQVSAFFKYLSGLFGG